MKYTALLSYNLALAVLVTKITDKSYVNPIAATGKWTTRTERKDENSGGVDCRRHLVTRYQSNRTHISQFNRYF